MVRLPDCEPVVPLCASPAIQKRDASIIHAAATACDNRLLPLRVTWHIIPQNLGARCAVERCVKWAFTCPPKAAKMPSFIPSRLP